MSLVEDRKISIQTSPRFHARASTALAIASLAMAGTASAQSPLFANVLDNEPVTEKQRTDAAPFIARINALDDIAQLQTELAGLYTFFNYTEHVVNDHGENDGGRVLLTRDLLGAAWQRYIDVADSDS